MDLNHKRQKCWEGRTAHGVNLSLAATGVCTPRVYGSEHESCCPETRRAAALWV